MSTKKASRPFKESSKAMLKDPETAAVYLEEILATGDIAMFQAA